MKNYDIKNAAAELSVGKKIKVGAKRIAFLVPNMFGKLRSGFKRKISLSASKFNIEEAKEQAQIVKEEVVEEKVAKIDEGIQAKEQAMEQVQAATNLDEKMKAYIVKEYASDIAKLTEKRARVSSTPRKLLISTVFLRKLVTNRAKKFIDDRAEKKLEKNLDKTIDEQLANMPSFEEAKIEKPVETVEDAMQKYIDLNNERLRIQEEMTELVQKYGLTKEMFDGQYGKAK